MNNEPTLTELRAFMAVARHRSFRKAAEELGMAPSTVSHMLTGLEKRLGVRLLNRSTRSVSATQAGEQLIDRLRPVLGELDTVLAEVDAARDRPAGLLRLTASETVAMLLVQTVLPTFLKQFPEMEVDLLATPAFVDIAAGGFDAGFRLGESVPSDMVAVRFGGESRMLVVASPDYLAGRALPLTPDDLGRHRCIRSRTPNGRPYRWEFERNGQALNIDVTGPMVLNRTELMLEAALQGGGIAFVPERLARPHLKSGALTSLLLDWCPSYPGLYLYYSGHRQVPAGLRAFIEVLKTIPIGD